MTWSYSGNPASSNRDSVRFLIFDTDTNDQLLSNEEIDYVLTKETKVHMAAAMCAEALAAKFARDIDRSVIGMSANPSRRPEFYLDLADRLRDQVGQSSSHAEVFAGGLTISGKDSLDADSDAVQPSFSIGQFDRSGTGVYTGPGWTEPQ